MLGSNGTTWRDEVAAAVVWLWRRAMYAEGLRTGHDLVLAEERRGATVPTHTPSWEERQALLAWAGLRVVEAQQRLARTLYPDPPADRFAEGHPARAWLDRMGEAGRSRRAGFVDAVGG
jgi:hypothetical protein